MPTQAWITLHHEQSQELLLNVNYIESIEQHETHTTDDLVHCTIRMVSGKVWEILDYDVDELSGLFDEIITT